MKTSPQQSLSYSKSSSDKLFDTTSFALNSNSSSNLSMRNHANFESLSNILMNKTGPYHTIGYLGSAILTKGKTGLGCLQQPLRELYCIFRKNGSRLMQERRLVVSIDGLTMLYSDQGVEKFIHNNLSSVYDIQLLKLVNDTRRDKRSYAFLPVNNDQDVNLKYSNLFQPIDKQFLSYVENTNHPPIIALIMRRSCGIQALECHVIITRTSNDAIKIVNDIKNICVKYKHELSQQTQVFEYKSENNSNFGQMRETKNLTQLPPKSPFIKPQKEKEQTVIYDAYQENSDTKLSSKSTNDLASKSSIFGRIKNIKGCNSKNKKSLSSSSEIIFVDKNDKNSNTNTEIGKSNKKSTCSLTNICDSDKKMNKKALKQESSSSLSQSEKNKKEKKQSLGKRIISSARSSLKSNTSKNKNLNSNSTSSLTSMTSTKSKKDIDRIADVDFRKSKTSLFSDSLIIDKTSMGNVFVQQSPSLSRPPNICLENKINFIPASPNLTSTRREAYSKSRSRIVASPNQLLVPEQRSASCSKTTLDNSINFNKLDEVKYYKKVFKLPVSDPKLLSNHLVWNKSMGSAECLDKEEVVFKVKNFSPIARVISPGGFNYDDFDGNIYLKNEINFRNDERNRNYYEENRYRSKSQSHGMVFRPRPPTSLVPEINCSALKESRSSSKSYIHDSAYSTSSSKISEPEPKEEITSLKNQQIVMNRLKEKQEEEIEKRTKFSITSHKIVGGVKVFPTLPQEFRLAAEMRQKRLAEIENNLNKTSIEHQLKQKVHYEESTSNNREDHEEDQEIIDLTINREEMNDSKLNSSFREIPIQIITNKIENENDSQIHSKSFISYKHHMNNNEYMESKCQENSNKSNFIYYYDNEQFAGY